MKRSDFYNKLCHAKNLDSVGKALLILWFEVEAGGVKELSPIEIVKIMREFGIGSPNQTILREKLKNSRQALKRGNKFYLKTSAKTSLKTQASKVLGISLETVNLENCYLMPQVWKETRDYIEKVCIQINGCYQYGFFDGAAVMIRRLIETLIIEAYEYLKREKEIKDRNDDYLMLDDLVAKVIAPNGLSLSREAKKQLIPIQKLGNLSSHNRRFNARQPDLDKISSGTRILAEELINIALLKRRPLIFEK